MEALVLLSKDDVDDAGDRIRTVQSGGAVLQDLDLLDGREGNGGEVDEAALVVIEQRVGH